MDATLVTEATNIAAHYGLRGADAIYVAVAKQVGIPLLTWDNEQLTRPAAIISAITP
jgi:predicted nucleic acid-binding protein